MLCARVMRGMSSMEKALMPGGGDLLQRLGLAVGVEHADEQGAGRDRSPAPPASGGAPSG